MGGVFFCWVKMNEIQALMTEWTGIVIEMRHILWLWCLPFSFNCYNAFLFFFHRMSVMGLTSAQNIRDVIAVVPLSLEMALVRGNGYDLSLLISWAVSCFWNMIMMVVKLHISPILFLIFVLVSWVIWFCSKTKSLLIESIIFLSWI